MNVLFMGTPDFAVASLKALIDNKYNISAVVTQPDKPVGRSGKPVFTPVKELAVSLNIKVYQPEKVREDSFVKVLKDINPDIIIVVAFGQILPKVILDIPKYGCVNVHGSLLPKYRGAAPIQWAIINGEKITGVTTMYMDKGMDTGDMIIKKEIPINDDETADILFERVSALGANALIETIDLIKENKAPRVRQNHTEATYSPMLKKEFGEIDWNKSANEIKNHIRGTYPWPGAYTFYLGKRMKVFPIDIVDKNDSKNPGQVIDVTKESVLVQTGNGLAVIKEIQFDGSKRMSVREYLAGHAIDKGIILTGEQNGDKN